MPVRRKGSVRPVSRAARFERLRSLRCFDLVQERVKQGWPLAEVARYIQEDHQEALDTPRTALMAILKQFRASLPPGQLVEQRLPQVFQEAVARIETSLDEVVEMETLYALQMQRVRMDFETEKKINKLLPSMTSEIREARQILESVANLKMELGLKQRAATEHTMSMEIDGQLEGDLAQHFGSAAAKKVLTDAESRRKVSGIVERFLKLSAVPDSVHVDDDDDLSAESAE